MFERDAQGLNVGYAKKAAMSKKTDRRECERYVLEALIEKEEKSVVVLQHLGRCHGKPIEVV